MKKHFQQQFMDQSNIEYWDTIYDQKNFAGDCYRLRMSTVLSWLEGLNLSENSIILEAGCGTGRFTHEAAKRGYNVFGMDFSHGMIVKASSICKREDELNVAFLRGDIESLPLKDSSFDVIVCLGVVAYLKSEEDALHELARALKPNGILAISIVNKARLVYRLDLPLLLITILKKILKDISVSRKKSADNKDDPPLTTYFIPKFRKSLERAGLTVTEYRTVPWKLLTFFGKEVFPQEMAEKITLFFERFSDIPIIGSFGGMCIFKAEKRSFETNEIRPLALL
jgi:ubiquinone/menaquinone biosynthesis C-methylase UbiE